MKAAAAATDTQVSGTGTAYAKWSPSSSFMQLVYGPDIVKLYCDRYIWTESCVCREESVKVEHLKNLVDSKIKMECNEARFVYLEIWNLK